MTDEDAFIRAILVDPRNVTLRLVYADWLDERGGASGACKAEYLRVECTLDEMPTQDRRRRRRLRDRLMELRKAVGDNWWQRLDSARVDYCVEFQYRCPQRWDTLKPTGDPAVRHCQECQRNVHYCRTTSEAYRLADAGQCVAIDSRQVRLPLGLLRRRPGRLLGRIAPQVPRRIPLQQRGATTE